MSISQSQHTKRKQMNPKYWDDADAGDVQDAYGEDWEKIAAFEYDGVAYTMVKILEPVLVLAKEDLVRLVSLVWVASWEGGDWKD